MPSDVFTSLPEDGISTSVAARDVFSPVKTNGLVINYGEGVLHNGKIRGPKPLHPPPPLKQGKTFLFFLGEKIALFFKEWKILQFFLKSGNFV